MATGQRRPPQAAKLKQLQSALGDARLFACAGGRCVLVASKPRLADAFGVAERTLRDRITTLRKWGVATSGNPLTIDKAALEALIDKAKNSRSTRTGALGHDYVLKLQAACDDPKLFADVGGGIRVLVASKTTLAERLGTTLQALWGRMKTLASYDVVVLSEPLCIDIRALDAALYEPLRMSDGLEQRDSEGGGSSGALDAESFRMNSNDELIDEIYKHHHSSHDEASGEFEPEAAVSKSEAAVSKSEAAVSKSEAAVSKSEAAVSKSEAAIPPSLAASERRFASPCGISIAQMAEMVQHWNTVSPPYRVQVGILHTVCKAWPADVLERAVALIDFDRQWRPVRNPAGILYRAAQKGWLDYFPDEPVRRCGWGWCGGKSILIDPAQDRCQKCEQAEQAAQAMTKTLPPPKPQRTTEEVEQVKAHIARAKAALNRRRVQP